MITARMKKGEMKNKNYSPKKNSCYSIKVLYQTSQEKDKGGQLNCHKISEKKTKAKNKRKEYLQGPALKKRGEANQIKILDQSN